MNLGLIFTFYFMKWKVIYYDKLKIITKLLYRRLSTPCDSMNGEDWGWSRGVSQIHPHRAEWAIQDRARIGETESWYKKSRQLIISN